MGGWWDDVSMLVAALRLGMGVLGRFGAELPHILYAGDYREHRMVGFYIVGAMLDNIKVWKFHRSGAVNVGEWPQGGKVGLGTITTTKRVLGILPGYHEEKYPGTRTGIQVTGD